MQKPTSLILASLLAVVSVGAFILQLSWNSSPSANQQAAVIKTLTTPLFIPGDTIVTTTAVTVRSAAGSGKTLATLPAGATGTIIGGPTIVKTDLWWNVSFTSPLAVTGWIIDSSTLSREVPIQTLAGTPTNPILSWKIIIYNQPYDVFNAPSLLADNYVEPKLDIGAGSSLPGNDSAASAGRFCLSVPGKSYTGGISKRNDWDWGFKPAYQWSGTQWTLISTATTAYYYACTIAPTGGGSPPTVSITSPASGTTYTTPTPVPHLTTNATDDKGVFKVEFYDNGVLAPYGTDPTYPFTYDYYDFQSSGGGVNGGMLTTAQNGVHNFTAKAYDGEGNTAVSSPVTITVNIPVPDTVSPSVSLTQPTGGTTVSGTITLTASSSDNIGVASVKFTRDGGILLGSVSSSPYTLPLNTTTLTYGTHTLSATAYDAAGNSATSTITVFVDNAPPSIYGITNTAISTSSAVIVWTTDENANSQVDYGLTTSYGSSTTLNPALVAIHAVTLSNLTPGITYHYRLKSADQYGNLGVSGDGMFTTQAGTQVQTWVKGIGGTLADSGKGIAYDSQGNVIVTGYFSGTADFDPGVGVANLTSANGNDYDIFIAKYDATGNYIWAKRYGSTGYETPSSIALDSSNNIFVGGYFSGSGSVGGTATSSLQSDAFIAKYDSSGNYIWSKLLQTTSSDTVNGVAVDSQGNVIATGYYLSSSPGISFGDLFLQTIGLASTDAFIVKFSSSGAGLWAKTFQNYGGYEYGTGVAVDRHVGGNDSIFISGYAISDVNLGGSPLYGCGFIAKFASSGAHTWSQCTGSSDLAHPWAIAVDNNGDPIITGDFRIQTDFGNGTTVYASAPNYDGYVAKYSGTNGSYVWAQPIHGSLDIRPAGIITDAQNNIIITGNFRSTYNFGNQSLTTTGAWDTYDGFIAKYSSAGAPVWAKKFGGTSHDGGTGISVNSSGYLVVTGGFADSMTFDSTTIPGFGGTDAVIMRVGQ